MSLLEKNQLHTVTITGYSAEGMGIARVDQRVVFVHGAVRGETCVIRILKVLKNVAFARVEEILERSENRIESDCPNFPACGGCDFRHLTYSEELEAKRIRVQDALQRIGGADIEVHEILGSEETAFYRNKSQFPVNTEGKAGFYRARSHDVIPTTRCLLQTPQAGAIARAVEEYMQKFSVPAYDEKTGKGLLRHIYVRTNREGAALVCLIVNGKKLPHEAELVEGIRAACGETVGIVLNVNTRDTNVILGDTYRTLWGEDTLMDTLCGLSFRLSIPSFYQVNRPQAERLYAKTAELADLTGNETLLDLYCGAGTITLSMADKAKRVIGAEIVPEAIENAKENAKRNGITNAEFFCGDAGDIAAKLARDNLRPDVVVVDPPRKGLSEDVIAAIRRMSPDRVVYVSCDCGTLARDVKLFREVGYELKSATAVDMFPRTSHVESVVCLSRNATHEMKLHASPFEKIKSGTKNIELRLYDEKRQKIKAGDDIIFTNTVTGEKMCATVKKLYLFDSFEKLYGNLPLLQCGYTAEDIDTAQPSDMEQYYSAEQQSKYGVVGIELFPPKRITDETVALLVRKTN